MSVSKVEDTLAYGHLGRKQQEMVDSCLVQKRPESLTGPSQLAQRDNNS